MEAECHRLPRHARAVQRMLELRRVALQQGQSLRPFGGDADLQDGPGRVIDLDLQPAERVRLQHQRDMARAAGIAGD